MFGESERFMRGKTADKLTFACFLSAFSSVLLLSALHEICLQGSAS